MTTIVIILIALVVTWPIAGVAGYWLAVLFDRVTGLGFALPSGVLADRHPYNQFIRGWTLFLDVALSLPMTWQIREKVAQTISIKDSGQTGVVISGKPAGKEDGWYKQLFVPGALSYKEAREPKKQAVWASLNNVELT